MNRSTRIAFSSLLLLAVLAGVPVWLTWRAVRQEQLDRALISAVARYDARAVTSLLKQGADPNARPHPPAAHSLWQRWSDLLRKKHDPSGVYPNALMLLTLRDIAENQPDRYESREAILRDLLRYDAHPAFPRPSGMDASLRDAERKRNRIPVGPPMADKGEAGGRAFDLRDAEEAFQAVLNKYGPFDQGYTGLARCRLRKDRYADAAHAFRMALLMQPQNPTARSGLAQAEILEQCSRAVSHGLVGGQTVLCVRAYPVEHGRTLWAVLYGRKAGLVIGSYTYSSVRLGLFAENGAEYRQLWHSDILEDPRFRGSYCNEIQMFVFPLRKTSPPDILVHSILYGASWIPSHMDVFAWRKGKLASILALSSSEPLRLDDLRHDGRYQISNEVEIGDTLFHFAQPGWSDIYDYANGRYVLADRKFPEMFDYRPQELKETLSKYPEDPAILHYLAFTYQILGKDRQARDTYREAERATLRALAKAETRQEKGEFRKRLRAIRQERGPVGL